MQILHFGVFANILQNGVYLQETKLFFMKLKAVSYAVLGQLALHSWSAYELIKEMQRNFHYFYPRAESGLYEELKKLERAGCVSSSVGTKGKKERTVYTISEEGKKALKEWLSTDPEPSWLEFEGLLRVFLSKYGEKEALRNVLSKVKSDAEILISLAEKVGNEYLSGEAPAQSEIAQRVIVFDFLLHYGMLYREWLDRTQAYLNQLENLPPEEAEANAKLLIKKHLDLFGLKIGAEH